MTPGARVAAAIEILDQVLSGAPAEQALTRWARRSRFAGSKDRVAVRDHVFDGLRNLRRFAALGGWDGAPDPSGRQVMIGATRAAGTDLDLLFDGVGHAPDPLDAAEIQPGTPSENDKMNLPDWLCDRFRADLGAMALDQAEALSRRAPVCVRTNTVRISRADLQSRLAEDNIQSAPNPLAPAALTVTGGERRLTGHAAFAAGLFEMQDAASQAVIAALPLTAEARVLDYCAGGGGKSLAMAASGARVTAHDASAQRMAPLRQRADRAGVSIRIEQDRARLPLAGFDLVLVDAPCSGSGSWRRAPDAKWRLTPARLDELVQLQGEILAQAAQHVRPGGWLGYATCSVLHVENAQQADQFALTRGWRAHQARNWPISDAGDGFFLALFQRSET